jgi:hypothetical protein
VGACKTSCSTPGDCQTNFNCVGGQCVRIPESDCLDGLDNNGDGLIDCGDPSCNDQVTCVPSAPTPVGGVAASCPGGVTGTHINQGLQVPTSCHACGCTVSGTCSFTMKGDQNGTGCFVPSFTLGTFTPATSCIQLPSPAQYYSVQAVGVPNATCGALQTGIPDATSYATSKSFCPSPKSPSAAACGANQICVPKPAAAAPVCTLVNGATCPGTYPTASGTWYADGTSSDNRACSCSGCTVTSNGTCDANQLQWVVHTSANSAAKCIDNPAPYSYCAGGCCSWNAAGTTNDGYWAHLTNVDALQVHAFPNNAGASCNGGTGTVAGGTATPGATMTVCCQ